MKKKNSVFIRIIKDDKNFLKFKGNINQYQAGKIIEYIATNQALKKEEKEEVIGR